MNHLFQVLTASLVSFVLLVCLGVPYAPSLSKAIEQSQMEQRPLMIFFVGEDCPDCPRVEAFLERDDVKNAIAENYVAARVDVADFDGNACREIYGIAKIPAVVIVDSKGTVMFKVQGEMPEEELIAMLTKPKIKSDLSTAIPTPTQQETKPVESSPAETKQVPVDDASAGAIDTPPITKTVSVEKSKQPKRPVATEEAYEFSGKSYSLQFGFFSTSENANKMRERAKTYGLSGVRVVPEKRDGNTYYRVLWGKYPTAKIADERSAPIIAAGFEVKVHRN